MRQVFCFGLGAVCGLPVFFLTKGSIGVTFASMLMIVIMLPFFLFAMYEQHGQPLEVILRHIVFNANTFPFETPHACMLDNSHAEEKSKDDFCGIQWRMPLFFMLAISTGEWYHSTCNFEFSFPRGRINMAEMKWTRKPLDYRIEPDRIEMTTAPHTDLWQRTYYHFRNDNAPVLQYETEKKYFSFIVKTDFSESHHRFDQCGIVMYLDAENWLKGSVEYENESFQHLGSVVTNHGYSDWATTAIPSDVKVMWYRFSRREDDYCIECSRDGKKYTQMRVCHMWEGAGKISFGIYACSPENSSFKAIFTEMQITECAWKAHDGQQPD